MERWREWWKEGRVGGLFGGLCQKPHVWCLGIKSDDLDCDTGWQRCSWLLVSPFHHATCGFQRSRATVTQWGLYLMHFKGALFFLTCDLSYKIKGALLLYSKLYVDSTKPNLITNLFNICIICSKYIYIYKVGLIFFSISRTNLTSRPVIKSMRKIVNI